jgi:hypothetical protein
MSERVSTAEAIDELASHPPWKDDPFIECGCPRCLVLHDLLDARARAKELEEALEELMAWGVEWDSPHISYITVQVDRAVLRFAERALRGEEPCKSE